MADFGQSDFGQTDFGQPFWRPSLAKPTLASVSVLVVWPTLAKTNFGQTDFGQTEFDLLCVLCCVVLCCVVLCCVVLCCVLCVVCVAWVLVSRFHGVGFHVWVLVSRFGLDRPSPGPPFPWTAQNFALFFSLSRRKFRSFLLSLGVFSLNFGGVFESSNVHVWALCLSCETPAASGPPVLHTTTRELRTCTFERSGDSNTTKIPREDTQRGKKRTNFVAGEGKKSAKFWGPHPSGPRAVYKFWAACLSSKSRSWRVLLFCPHRLILLR